MSTDVPVRQCTCSVYFLFFGITCTVTFQLIHWGTYTQIHPKINLPVYLHASLSTNRKDLPVSTTACVPAHIWTRSWPYLFIFIQTFWQPLRSTVNVSTVLHVHRCTCSSLYLFTLFFFGVTCAMTFQLIYWGTYTQIHPKINLPVYPHASLSSLQQRPTCLHNYLYTCP